MPDLTLLDVAKRTGNDQTIGLIEESIDSAPELRTLPLRVKQGTSYTTLVRTALGGGGFRNVGEGIARVKSQFKKVLVEMFFFDAQMQVDEALVKSDPDLLNDEAVGAVRGSLVNLGKQVYAGKVKDAKGFPGFKSRVDASMVENAEGTGSTDTVWFVVEGPQGVHLPISQQDMLALAGWTKQRVTDDDGKSFMAHINNLCSWIGLQVGHKYAIGCVKNVTADKPFTDALGAKLLADFPVGMTPTRCFMSRSARYGLQKSRSAVGAQKSNGAGDAFAPTPTEVSGVPIVVTDSIDQIAAW